MTHRTLNNYLFELRKISLKDALNFKLKDFENIFFVFKYFYLSRKVTRFLFFLEGAVAFATSLKWAFIKSIKKTMI